MRREIIETLLGTTPKPAVWTSPAGTVTLTSTPLIKEGDTGLTAEQVWDLPKGSVIWPENAERPEPWMRFSNRWVGCTRYVCDAGDLQCATGDSFRVLVLGGDK